MCVCVWERETDQRSSLMTVRQSRSRDRMQIICKWQIIEEAVLWKSTDGMWIMGDRKSRKLCYENRQMECELWVTENRGNCDENRQMECELWVTENRGNCVTKIDRWNVNYGWVTDNRGNCVVVLQSVELIWRLVLLTDTLTKNILLIESDWEQNSTLELLQVAKTVRMTHTKTLTVW
jgi:hypothetical protein